MATTSCVCGSGWDPFDCCAPWTLDPAARTAALDTVAAPLGMSGARLAEALDGAAFCVDVAPRLGPLPGVSPLAAARAVRRAWLLLGRPPDLLHLVAASEVEPDAPPAVRCARAEAWARLVEAAPLLVIRALYAEDPDLASARLLDWVSATDAAMYETPARAEALLRGLRAVRARLPELPDPEELDVAELFFTELAGEVAAADALHARILAASPGAVRPAVERAAARLFPCRPGVAPDPAGALALLEVVEGDEEARETWDIAGRIARLRAGLPWEESA